MDPASSRKPPRALGADVDRLPEIPPELASYIAALTPQDLERIRGVVREMERIGLLPTTKAGAPSRR